MTSFTLVALNGDKVDEVQPAEFTALVPNKAVERAKVFNEPVRVVDELALANRRGHDWNSGTATHKSRIREP